MRMFLFGYYGFRNLGDDIMLQNLINYFLERENIERIYLVVKDNYYKFPSRKLTIVSNSEFLAKFKKFYTISDSDIIVWGGGTCLYNNKGLKSLYKYWKLSRFLKKDFAFLGIGVGKLNGKFKKWASLMLQTARYISVRDQYSYEFVKNYNNNVCLGGDLAFLMFEGNKTNKRPKTNEISNVSFSGVNIGKEAVNFYASELRKIIASLNVKIHLLPAHKEDEEFHRALALRLSKEHVIIHPFEDVNSYVKVLGQMDFHIGMRLHSLVLSDIYLIPNIAIEYAPKVRFYLEKMGDVNRLVKAYVPLSIRKIEQVFSNYDASKIITFIEREKRSAIKCLNNFTRIVT